MKPASVAITEFASRIGRFQTRDGKLPRGSPLKVLQAVSWGSISRADDAIWLEPPAPDSKAQSTHILELQLLVTCVESARLVNAMVQWVVFSPEPRLGTFARVFGRSHNVARALRGSALLMAGCTDIAGGVDPASGLDLIWGRLLTL